MYVFPWHWSTFHEGAKIKKGEKKISVDEFLEKVKVDSFESNCMYFLGVGRRFLKARKSKKGRKKISVDEFLEKVKVDSFVDNFEF